jgi:hypothetical protein
VLAPMPSASITIADAQKTGCLASERRAYRNSCTYEKC